VNLTTRVRDVQTALGLEIFNVSYNIGEGIFALAFGIAAASLSLEAFGLDSIIEVTAGVILIWRLMVERRGGDKEQIERAATSPPRSSNKWGDVAAVEHRAEKFVGITLFALAAYIVFQAAFTLYTQQAPDASVPGIILAIASLIIMPLIARWKLRLADRIESRALRADAFETIACAYLSFTLLLGLAANYFFGWWWADPLAALVMVYFIVREAREALAGEQESGD
jgi:divalent metal cation (Fe/Co/Zn/Cd) transporter